MPAWPSARSKLTNNCTCKEWTKCVYAAFSLLTNHTKQFEGRLTHECIIKSRSCRIKVSPWNSQTEVFLLSIMGYAMTFQSENWNPASSQTLDTRPLHRLPEKPRCPLGWTIMTLLSKWTNNVRRFHHSNESPIEPQWSTDSRGRVWMNTRRLLADPPAWSAWFAIVHIERC